MRILNSDELGAKGEAKFEGLCADAKLTCNKSSRDRTGWDYLVEFPFDIPLGEKTLDKRGSAISCHVQVKTVWWDNPRIKLRLSSAERLAKEPKPAFIYVINVNEDLSFGESYLIHLHGKNVVRILKRLREEERDTGRINRVEITFDPKTAGIRLEPSGRALRDQLQKECEENLQAYIAEKDKELKNLGFGQDRYQVEATIEAGSVDEIVDSFLGLRPIRATVLESLEFRFGIPLPLDDRPVGASSKLAINPGPAGRCTIRVFSKPGIPPSVFIGEVFFPVIKLPKAAVQALIRTKFFTVKLRRNGPMRFETAPEVKNGGRFSLSEWKSFIRLMAALGIGETQFEITLEEKDVKPVTITCRKQLNEQQLQGAQALLLGCEHAEHLLNLAGVSVEDFTLAELEQAVPELDAAYLIMTQRAEGMILPFETTRAPLGSPNSADFLYTSAVTFGNVSLAYGAVVKMTATAEADYLVWRPTAVSKPRVSQIADKRAYDDFVEALKSNAGLINLMIRDLQ
ncbi:MAG: hypothetical protein JO007_00210 [Alphaproteobacteria bacterium]|nr:hypothetical protein [Alphaproteobacteria bacterium]